MYSLHGAFWCSLIKNCNPNWSSLSFSTSVLPTVTSVTYGVFRVKFYCKTQQKKTNKSVRNVAIDTIMSSSTFDDVLTSLQSVQDSTKLLKLLIEVRKRVDVDCAKNNDNITKIRERGSFKQIISSLQTSKKGIINVSLSILGNCCLDARCARDVVCYVTS